MRNLYFDCFAGASGDMILGALISAGVDPQVLIGQLELLEVSGWQIDFERVNRSGIGATYARVQTAHEHAHRHLSDILKIIMGIPLAYAPGTKCDYSNLGYATLGILIHRVTGKFYGDFLQERIFHPLGMATTRIISEAVIVPNRSSGYRLDHGVLKNQEWVSPSLNTTADGSLYFSVLDLAKWDAALYTEKLLHRSSFDQMWTTVRLADGQPNSGHYGFGWFIDKQDGHRLVQHSGAWQGFQTHISRYIDDKLTIIALSNLGGSKPSDICDGVGKLYLSGTAPGSAPSQ